MSGVIPPAWSITEAMDEGEQVEKLRAPFATMTPEERRAAYEQLNQNVAAWLRQEFGD